MNAEELRILLVLANEFKEGDLLVGGGRDEVERREARQALSRVTLKEIDDIPVVEDRVSEALHESLDSRLNSEISHLSVRELKQRLLEPAAPGWIETNRDGLSSESIGAAVKIMSNEELCSVATRVFNPLPGAGITIGSPRHFGSRIQPNSPGDDEEEILFSVLEGLSYGCGDVILGINPAGDDLDVIINLEALLARIIDRLQLPTRYSVLSDIVKQTSAREKTEVDVGFQSLAGTSAMLQVMVGLDVDGLAELARGFSGLYFETGQGSAVTNGAAQGVDMVTLESRAYGLARHIRRMASTNGEKRWMIVNDVAGFIGPEVFRTPDQLLRACLEDIVMAKLHGITMGLDVCATFHMGISPTELRSLTRLVVEQAAPAYLMAVAGNADPMLGYLTTSFREHPRLRRSSSKQVTTVMQNRLVSLGLMNDRGEVIRTQSAVASLYAEYLKAGQDWRSLEAIREEGERKLREIVERGFDLGCGYIPGSLEDPGDVTSRIEAIYQHAREALYATIAEGVLKAVSQERLRVRTGSRDREDYLSHPPSGEVIRDDDVPKIRRLYLTNPQIQIVISDGLNANAVNENLRALLPPLRSLLSQSGHRTGEVDVVISNGRVRAGYHVGELVNADVIIHLIGERPGTGLNTLSAYLTYGRDSTGASRWSVNLHHSATTAICGIHPHGKPPATAAAQIAELTTRILTQRRSGVHLR